MGRNTTIYLGLAWLAGFLGFAIASGTAAVLWKTSFLGLMITAFISLVMETKPKR